jgi:hypothetical protein
MIIMCYSIHFEDWSLTDEVVHEISLISKTSSKMNFFFFKNSEMMPQICKYHEQTKYGYAQRLFLKQPQSHMKHELGQDTRM